MTKEKETPAKGPAGTSPDGGKTSGQPSQGGDKGK